MAKRKDKKDKESKRAIIRSKRSDKRIVDQFTRKFRRIIQSEGKYAAADWLLSYGSTRSIGKGKNRGRIIVLPMEKLNAILRAS